MEEKRVNPFSDEYTRSEIEWYGLKEAVLNGVMIRTHKLQGRADEFFNKRYWIGEIDAPILTIDGRLWMSLTPLEVQSAYLAIQEASGVVGTGGLGMGYYPLKVALKDDVEKVFVYEINGDVIRFFNKHFSDREGFDKIEVVHKDVFEVKGGQFDYFFMDIYKTQLPDAVMMDMMMFTDNNYCERYKFWCEEKVVLQAMMDEAPDVALMHERWFFGAFFSATYDINGKPHEKVNLYAPLYDDEFIEDVLRTMERI